MKTIRAILEESIWDSGEDYLLKTDDEIIEIIQDFGNGLCEFHTLDVNRLVAENQRMKELLNIKDV